MAAGEKHGREKNSSAAVVPEGEGQPSAAKKPRIGFAAAAAKTGSPLHRPSAVSPAATTE